MATRHISGKCHRCRDIQVREHVITLTKYLDKVIRDIKYVVGDLQLLLEQIDLVSRRLDESTELTTVGAEHSGGKKSLLHKRSCSHSTAYGQFANPLLRTAIRSNCGTRKTKRSSKSKNCVPEDSSSLGSRSSLDGCKQRGTDNAMELDRLSVELNCMWDNAFDNDLVATGWTDDTWGQDNTSTMNTNLLCNRPEDTVGIYSQQDSWLSGKLEQSLTSGIEMLSFTDDSEEDCVSSGLPVYVSQSPTKSKETCVSIEPVHVCCKDVIPLEMGRTYCGVYEAAFEASLEPNTYFSMAESDSFNSDVSLFDKREDICDVTVVNYEPMYDTQLNTWTAFTMTAVDSLHTSADDLSESTLDILNDNISPSVLDNVDDNMDNSSTNGVIPHTQISNENFGKSINAYIFSS